MRRGIKRGLGVLSFFIIMFVAFNYINISSNGLTLGWKYKLPTEQQLITFLISNGLAIVGFLFLVAMVTTIWVAVSRR